MLLKKTNKKILKQFIKFSYNTNQHPLEKHLNEIKSVKKKKKKNLTQPS